MTNVASRRGGATTTATKVGEKRKWSDRAEPLVQTEGVWRDVTMAASTDGVGNCRVRKVFRAERVSKRVGSKRALKEIENPLRWSPQLRR